MSRAFRIHLRRRWREAVKETPAGKTPPSWKLWRAAFGGRR